MDNNKRPESMERITTPELAKAFIDEQVKAIRAQVGGKKVLLALSGGVDSSVVAKPSANSWSPFTSTTVSCARANPSRSSKCSATRWTPT